RCSSTRRPRGATSRNARVRMTGRKGPVRGLSAWKVRTARAFPYHLPPRYLSKKGTMDKQRVLTGITTSGTPHLGNYVGAIRPAVAASRKPELQSFYFLADFHALIKN